jgi:aquaporin Z
MKKCGAEFIGAFALVFAGTGAIVINEVSGGAITHVGVSLTFGLIVLVMIYAVGDVSGAHLNPAVSLGFFAAGRFPFRELVPYILSQCAGAFAASGMLHFLFPQNATLGTTQPAGSAAQAFVLELIFTAILMFVILSVSTGRGRERYHGWYCRWFCHCTRGHFRRAHLRSIHEPCPILSACGGLTASF